MKKQIDLQRIEQDGKRVERLQRQIERRTEPEKDRKQGAGPALWTTRFGASGKPPVT